MKTTKSEISKIFAELRKFGFLVFNFNSDKKFNRGRMVGFVDYFIIGKNKIYFVEVKIGADDLSYEQEKFKEMLLVLEHNTNDQVSYFNVSNLGEAIELKVHIITN